MHTSLQNYTHRATALATLGAAVMPLVDGRSFGKRPFEGHRLCFPGRSIPPTEHTGPIDKYGPFHLSFYRARYPDIKPVNMGVAFM